VSEPLPPNARCPRCGGAFRCGVGDPGPCACTGLVLPPALLQQLQASHSGCLCLDCLHELAAAAPQAPAGPSARRD
jgi:Cysteine-rich CWC